MASFLADEMNRLGYRGVRIDRAGNVLGEAGRGRAKLLLCGHMDTVPGKLKVRQTPDALYGRGAADAKSALCALLVAGAEAGDAGITMTFAGVTEEEGDGAGIEQILRSGTEFDFAVFGEPSGAERITIGYRGRVSVTVSVKTPGGHAGSAWANKSAFEEFSSFLSRLKEYEASKRVDGDHFRSLSITPTLVSAGRHQNVVPDTCEATLDLRLPPSILSSSALGDIRAMAEEDRDDVTIRIANGAPTEAYEADMSSGLVRAFQRAILTKVGSKPKLIRKTGTGDMNTFARASGSQCLTYGPGVSATSHTDGEHVKVRDYLNSIEVVKGAVAQLANMETTRVRP